MEIVCKNCGAKDGFFVLERVTGNAKVYYSNIGKYEEDQSDMYGTVSHSGGKLAYCQSCKEYIGKSEKLILGNTL